MLRRVLLGLATALIALRALLPGEDVGLLEPGSNPMGLIIPVLWLAGLAAWAAWRSWSRQLDWYGGLVEMGLLIVVMFSFIGTAAVASYRHPAWVAAWEWAGMLAAFFLVRQIARSAAEQRGLLAALLATGVSLAVQSLYQRALPDPGRAPLPGLTADELPRFRCASLAVLGTAPQNAFTGNMSLPSLAAVTSRSDPTLFERIAARNNVHPETGEPVLPLDLRPTPPRPPTATFSTESNLAACLALLLPALVGCALAAWLGGGPRWQLGVALGCELVTALALALTLVRSAITPCLLVGAAASVLAWRHYSTPSPLAPVLRGEGSGVRGSGLLPLTPDPSPRYSGERGTGRIAGPSRRLLLFLALAGSGALLVLAFVLRPSGGHGLDDLTREWSAAWTMIRDHFWLGVGPGNYGRVYPQYMDPTAPTFARQPDSFILEVWATLGLPALLALGVALVNFFWRTLSVVPGQGQGTEDEGSVTRWEFYEGGMIGLVIGFLLRALPAGPDAIKPETVDAVVRAIVWFAVFALIQGIRWSGATRVLACTAGVAALLLHLAVSGGFFVPGVAQPLLILAPLALNGLPEQPVPVGHQIAGRVVPLALATAAALLCALQLFQPLTNAQSDNRTALAMGQKFLDVKSGVTRTLADGKTERLKPPDEVLPLVITFLEMSVQSDPGNASYWVNLADWYGTLYEENPKNDDYRLRGLKYALAAQQRDPFGQGGYLAESRLHQLGAAHAPTLEIRRQEVADSPGPLLKIVESRKYDAQLHYRLAVVFFGAGQPGAGKEHATRALKLDEAAPTPERRLTDPQRQQAKRFLGGP